MLENTSLVLVSPPHYIMPYVEIEILNVTIYVSLVACMSVGRVLTHIDTCACLIRVRGTTWAWPNPLRLPYPCCHTLLYTPQTITPCPYWSKLWFYKPADYRSSSLPLNSRGQTVREDSQARDAEREPHVIERTLWSLSHHVSKPFCTSMFPVDCDVLTESLCLMFLV